MREWLLARATRPNWQEAVDWLNRYCQTDSVACMTLTNLMSDPDKRVREWAIIYASCCPDAVKSVQVLLSRLRDDCESAVRAECCDALGQIARGDLDVEIGLREAMSKDKSSAVRRKAADALGRVCEHGQKPTVLALIEALKDPSPRVRAAAGSSLAAIGPADETIAPLIKVLQDKDMECACSIAIAFGEVGVDAIPAIRSLLKSDDERIAGLAAYAIGYVSRASRSHRCYQRNDSIRECASLATRLLKSKDVTIRRLVSRAFLLISRDAEPAIDRLAESLSDADVEVRVNCAMTLGVIGAPAGAVASRIVKALDDKAFPVRLEVVRALGEIGKPLDVVVPALIRGLKDEEPSVRWYAANSLGELKEEARDALPALRALRHDPEMQVRNRAERAMRRISGTERPDE